MNKNLLIGTAVAASVLIGGYFYFDSRDSIQSLTSDQKKTPHFLDSTPLHGDIYADQPINITLNFDFDLAEGSSISVVSADGTEWTKGEERIEDVKTALKKDLKQNMPDGSYQVSYTACWPDNSCHNGNFSFSIDSNKISEYTDLQGEKEVTVDMKDIAFVQDKLIVSPGTKIIWVNVDSVEHFVNTQTHPEHTYYPPQNSRGLGEGDEFSVTINTPGQYDYHCSAHADQMHGSIIVTN